MGEYRGIMNLCRVLPNGTDAKLAVDNAIDLASPIGNLRNDIVRWQAHSSRLAGPWAWTATAAHEAGGLHPGARKRLSHQAHPGCHPLSRPLVKQLLPPRDAWVCTTSSVTFISSPSSATWTAVVPA